MDKSKMLDPTEMMEVMNKADELMKDGGKGLIQNVKNFADINKDGKVDRNDLKELFKTILTFSLLVYGILIMGRKDEIVEMINGGNWIELGQFLEPAVILQGIVIIVSFIWNKFQKRILEDDKKIRAAETKVIVAEENTKIYKEEIRQQELKFELEQYRNRVEREVERLQYTTDADIVIKVKDAIARLELEYNTRLQKLLDIKMPTANGILDNSIQNIPNIQKVGVIDAIVTEQKQEAPPLCEKVVSSVPEVPKTDEPPKTLN